MRSRKPLLIVVGGFLGSGKTSLILCAADMLTRRGARVAVITNDQGDHLVDTRRARAQAIDAAEVGGGCFCCRFSALVEAADQLERFQPEYIFAEPVGSCTDVAATVLQPLLSFHAERFQVAPYTVLVDPGIAARAHAASPSSDLRFLFESQIREADVVCYTKADLYTDVPPPVDDEDPPLRVSTVTGEGVREWLTLVANWRSPAGANTIEIDYDRYAAAEASLGWLNAHVEIDSRVPSSPSHVIGPLLDSLDAALARRGASIVHLKLFDQTQSSYLKAAIVHNGQQPVIEGDLLAPAERQHQLTINLRAIAPPELLRSAVEEVLACIEGETRVDLAAFAPSYPKPEKRLSARV